MPKRPSSSDDLILRAAHLAPKQAIGEAVLAAAGDPAAAVDVLRRHRVLSLGLSTLCEDERVAEAPSVIEALEHRRNLNKLLNDGMEIVEQAANETGVLVTGIKGLAMRPQYPDPSLRDISDLDLMVADADDGWRLAAYLRSLDWLFHPTETPWVKRDVPSGRLYGQIPVGIYRDGRALGVDIHFAGYSLRHCRVSESTLTRADPNRAADTAPVDTCPPEDNLVALVGNAAGDHVILQKDVNDIVSLLRLGPAMDWDRALRPIADCKMGGFWNSLLDEVTRTSDLSAEQTTLVAALRLDGRATTARFGVPAPDQRARAAAIDAAQAGWSQYGLRKAVAMGREALRYYRYDHKLLIEDECAHNEAERTPMARLANDTCVRLIPSEVLAESTDIPAEETVPDSEGSELDGSALMITKNVRQHHIVAVGNERFVPTIWRRLCPCQVAGVLSPA